jgi:hypothetical protein
MQAIKLAIASADISLSLPICLRGTFQYVTFIRAATRCKTSKTGLAKILRNRMQRQQQRCASDLATSVESCLSKIYRGGPVYAQ